MNQKRKYYNGKEAKTADSDVLQASMAIMGGT